jgi:mRNA interferase MazF
MPEQGDVVLLPFPFADLSAAKQRPAIVVSGAAYHKTTADMIVVSMTTRSRGTTFEFQLLQQDLISGNLSRPGIVRVDKVFNLAQRLTVRVFGRVKDEVLDNIRNRLADLLAKS